MSNAARLATIFRKIGDAYYQGADELAQLAAEVVTEQPGRATGVPVSAQPAPVDDLPPMDDGFTVSTEPAEGSLAQCPKHRRPYKDGKFGPYCTSTSDDPAWSNAKGYCTINPKNVHVWLRAQAA